MYDKAMAAAVDTAQRRLMNSAEKNSVLTEAARDLAELNELTELIDPSKIDFDKGRLERFKANSYWNRFEEAYPRFRAVMEKLARDKKILYNSNVTVKRFYSEFKQEHDRFTAIPEEERDEEYIRQAVVAENMAMLMKSSLDEHEAVYEHIDMVLNIMEQSLNIGIYLARQKFGRSIGDGPAAVFGGAADNSSFQAQFRQLAGLLKNK